MQDDHYATLGVSRTASEREITRAYRRLARRYHPDVSAMPALTLELFFAAQDAYETLSDPRRRAGYDAELRQREHRMQSAAGTVGEPRWAPSRIVGPEVRHERPPPDAQPTALAFALLAASAVALVGALVVGNVVAGGTRFLWSGSCVVLAAAASMLARRIALRQREVLWRWTALAGRNAIERSSAARAASDRIRRADNLTLLGRRALLVAIPVVLLFARG